MDSNIIFIETPYRVGETTLTIFLKGSLLRPFYKDGSAAYTDRFGGYHGVKNVHPDRGWIVDGEYSTEVDFEQKLTAFVNLMKKIHVVDVFMDKFFNTQSECWELITPEFINSNCRFELEYEFKYFTSGNRGHFQSKKKEV